MPTRPRSCPIPRDVSITRAWFGALPTPAVVNIAQAAENVLAMPRETKSLDAFRRYFCRQARRELNRRILSHSR